MPSSACPPARHDEGHGTFHGKRSDRFRHGEPRARNHARRSHRRRRSRGRHGTVGLPNQINNVLAFPGIFRGALDVRARDINDDMMVAATKAIASLVDDNSRSAEYIIPGAFDERVAAVAAAVAQAARESGVARV